MKAETFKRNVELAVKILTPASFLFLAIFYFGKVDLAATIGGIMTILLVAKFAINKFFKWD